MRILQIAALHHPERLAAARAAAPPDEPLPLFPLDMAQHFWEQSFKRLGHEVYAFYRSEPALPLMKRLSETWLVRGVSQHFPRLNPDYRARNARLLEFAHRIRPDLILMHGDNEVIYPQTLRLIKAETDATLLYGCGTSPIVFGHPNDLACARLYDLVIANDFYHGIQWRELGARHMIELPGVACEPDFHHPYPLSDEERRAYTCDVSFVGTLSPDTLYSRRVEALEALRDFDLGVWSVGDVPASLRRFMRGKALGEEMLKVLSASKITINPHGDFFFHGGNMRLFEAAAVGTLQITDDLPGARQWFAPGETIVTYSDLRDLREKVAYYLAHADERQKIAEAARQHVYAHHTYDIRIAKTLHLVDDLRSRKLDQGLSATNTV
jgi:glycosyltransferase involved in cell wall biosynthesis